MITTLMREDPAFRHIGKWLVFSVLAATLVLNIAAFQAAKNDENAIGQNLTLWYSGLAWLLAASFLVFGLVRTRCSPLGMSLPISSRRLWTAHMTAVAIGVFAILSAFVVVAIGGSKVLFRLTDESGFVVREAVVATVQLASLAGLGIVLLDFRTPSGSAISQGPRGAALALVTAAAMLGVAILMMSLPLVVAIVPVLVAVLLGVRRLYALPESFSVTSDHADAGDVSGEALRDWQPANRSRFAGWMLVTAVTYRSILTKRAAPIITLPFVIFFGLLLSGMDEVWTDENLRSFAVTMGAYLLLAVVMEPMIQVSRIDAFPISRRRIFALLIMPCLVALAIGYGAGRIIIENRDPGSLSEAICFCQAEEGYYYTRVPIEYCELSWGGNIPDNEAPWGESHEAWRMPVHKGSFATFHSPFSVGEGASVDFAALQISRATEAVFGEAITPEEIKRRYLRERSDGSAALAVDELTLERDFPQLERQHTGPMFPVLFMLVSVLWLAAVRVYLNVMRAGNSKRKRMAVGFTVMAGLFALYVLFAVAAWTDFMQVWASTGFVHILARQISSAFWGGALLVWAGCFAIVVVTYRWVEKKFLRIECVLGGGDTGSGCC